MLERYGHTTTKISEGKYLGYGGYGEDDDRNLNSMILIEIEDLTLFAFHWIEVTGMLDFLGRNMCEEVYSVMWFYM